MLFSTPQPARASRPRSGRILAGMISSAGPPPSTLTVPARRGVARRAHDQLGALVRGLARHLGEHAVVADDQPELDALRPIAHRNAEVARLPRLDRHPRMQLAVVELDLPAVVDDQPAVVRVAVRVLLHDREAAPDLVLDAG